MTDVISHKRFQDEQAAYDWVEAHLWPHGPECPRCHGRERVTKLQGKSTRIGTYKCKDCRKPFTVKIGTIFEDSHIPMRMWLQAIALLCASKKGISSNQLHRMLGVTLKSAWFMSHRIREAMRDGVLAPFGSGGGDVEVDETFIGRDLDAIAKMKRRRPPTWSEKMKVLSLVDWTSGQARSFVVDGLSAKDVAPILSANIAKEPRLLSDEAPRYIGHGRQFREHGSVNHAADEYVSRTDPTVHTNNIEGFFSIFKRGMRGTYQHASKRHLHRYMAEFDFRYSARIRLGVNDEQRAIKALKGAKGKRLTYRTTDKEMR
jgi:transposase-like protein